MTSRIRNLGISMMKTYQPQFRMVDQFEYLILEKIISQKLSTDNSLIEHFADGFLSKLVIVDLLQI